MDSDVMQPAFEEERLLYPHFFLALVFVSLGFPTIAKGADPDQTMPTVLHWTGTQLNLDESNSYLSFSLNRQFFRGPLGPLRLGLRVTTPIEGKHRVVTSTRNPAHYNFGYNAKFTISWDTTYWARYDVVLSPLLRSELCPILRAKKGRKIRCNALTIERWRGRKANQALIAEWGKARIKLRRLVEQRKERQHAMQLRWYKLRRQLVMVAAQRMTPALIRVCQRSVGVSPQQAKSKPAMKGSLQRFKRAQELLRLRALQARRCAAHLRLALLAQEQKMTAAAHTFHRSQARLQRDIALYDELRQLPGRLEQRQRQRIAAFLFPSSRLRNQYSFTPRLYWALGFEFFFGADTIFLYRYQNAPRLEPLLQSSLQFGPRLTLYFAPYFAFTIRAGFEFSKEVELAERERCAIEAQAAQSSTHTCEDAYFLVAHPWYTRLYVRAALTSMFQFDAVTLGAEVRVALENIGLDTPGEGSLFDARIVLFSLAKTKSIYGRFNVGLALVHVLGETRRQRFLPGTTAFVPFVGVGGGF